MNQDWRYIHYADGTEELYDVRRDPHERKNLAVDPAFNPVKKKLAASAPETFAAPVENKSFNMVVEGDRFEWASR